MVSDKTQDPYNFCQF